MAEKRDCDIIFELGCLVCEKDKIIKQLRKETAELKRLLRLAVEDITYLLMYADYYHCYKACCRECFLSSNHTDIEQCIKLCDWKHAEEALKLLGDDADD